MITAELFPVSLYIYSFHQCRTIRKMAKAISDTLDSKAEECINCWPSNLGSKYQLLAS